MSPVPDVLPEQFYLKAEHIFTEKDIRTNAFVSVSDGLISGITSTPDSDIPVFEFPACKLMPGFIDLHIHGQAGADIMDSTTEALDTITTHLPKTGVVGFLGTTVTAPWQKILGALRNMREYLSDEKCQTHASGAELLGSYLEGPFFVPKQKGAHTADLFLEPTRERIAEILETAVGTLKVAAIAPGKTGAVLATSQLVAAGVNVAMGHSHSSYDDAQACIEAGASIAVHLFNAMSGLHHREPGCVGAFLTSDAVTTELIADGVHVHPAVLNLSWKCKGSDKAILITDCMCAGGLPDGRYQLGELPVTVANGVARTESGCLAGSTLALNRGIRNLVQQANVPEAEAVRMASHTPARLLGIDDRLGSIALGKEASLVVTDHNYNVLLTLRKGQPVYRKEDY